MANTKSHRKAKRSGKKVEKIRKKKSAVNAIQFVVDACIAAAAGPPNSLSQVSRTCREILLAISENSHKLVFSKALLAEWNDHPSNIARSIRMELTRRGLIVFLKDQKDDSWRRTLLQQCDTEEIKDIVEKDSHLVEAALLTDKRVVSADTKIKKHLLNLCDAVPDLKKIAWYGIYDNNNETGAEWIVRGAPVDDYLFVHLA